ncbi:hypothetical protein QBZ16_004956 [Prototheca wickerhamii]|uniref:AP2/ERF domain-containing protein n=1 Tax=Prototheca wickerhamii TaxID=3111 RepID=A0AAD9IJQ6_PROWI|nr:hypothetical protein QBZ16_004956 [Prototheca wickerhamii]
METSGPAAYLGKRRVLPGRFEAHVWSEGKQVYLGGYGLEIQAATAYDLAACKFRGQDAQTNFDIGRYAAELEDAVTSRESLVHLLRSQSKAMNAVVHDLSVQMEPWELEISTILHPDKQHLGVYQDERAAARAVDRQSILRYGIDASLSFPLVEYLDLLTPDQTKAAVAKGLLPPVLPANYSPAPAPVPLVTLADVQAPEPRPLPRLAHTPPPPQLELVEDSAHEDQGEADEAQQARAAADAGVAPEESTTLLPRAQSTTPKSVFDFMEFQNVFLGKS